MNLREIMINAQPSRIPPNDAAKTSFIIELTVTLVAAYVSRNAMPAADLPVTIRRIHAVLLALHDGTAHAGAAILPTKSQIAASIRHDRLVSFIDGKAYKSLKRHLRAHGMTPREYQSRFGLPSEYPMVSPSYATVRSRIAKQLAKQNRASFRAA